MRTCNEDRGDNLRSAFRDVKKKSLADLNCSMAKKSARI